MSEAGSILLDSSVVIPLFRKDQAMVDNVEAAERFMYPRSPWANFMWAHFISPPTRKRAEK